MAKEKVNKSQMVRDYLAEHPDAKANDVVKMMAEKGHKITANLVYYLKGKSAAKKQRRQRVMKAANAASAGGATAANGKISRTDPPTLVRELKTLAQRAGGYAMLRDLLDALAE